MITQVFIRFLPRTGRIDNIFSTASGALGDDGYITYKLDDRADKKLRKIDAMDELRTGTDLYLHTDKQVYKIVRWPVL